MSSDGTFGGLAHGGERRLAAMVARKERKAGLTLEALRLLQCLVGVVAHGPAVEARELCAEVFWRIFCTSKPVAYAALRLHELLASRLPTGLGCRREEVLVLESFGMMLSYDPDPAVALSGRLLLQQLRPHRACTYTYRRRTARVQRA